MANSEDLMHGPCWTEDRAKAILRSVAMANNDAEFLAVHQPIRDFIVTTTTGQSVASTEDALLENLSSPETRHALCVVEGEPGSGKSHLIRWLNVKWTKDDLIMLIERADGSLTGTLRQLRDKLGKTYAHLFENLAHSIETTFHGSVKLFHVNLAASLSRGFFAKAIGDEQWCQDWDLEKLIGNASVQARWGGPERVLNVIWGAGGRRDSASASFDLNDVISLTRLDSVLSDLTAKATMLMLKLKKECERIQPALSQRSSAELLLDFDFNIPESRRLLSALNRRRNFAVQFVLGISVDGLKDMFLRLRKELLTEKRRLVLLLEDVTSWEGIDGQLIDSLAVDAHTRADVCDMVSVVGMTPLYFENIQGNYQGRISHVIRLGRQRETGGFQETIQLSSTDAQVDFCASYLRAVRIEKDELDAWYGNGANPNSVPNACANCSSRELCFSSFGSHGDVGLFPFNRNAITNMFDALEDPRNSQNLQTPRGMIQGVLSPILLNPDEFKNGRFPPAEIESSEWMPERRLKPSSFLAKVIEMATDDLDKRNQLRRLAMLWGDPTKPLTVTFNVKGQPYFMGTAKGVFDAFKLPWLGEELMLSGSTALRGQDNDTVEAAINVSTDGSSEAPRASRSTASVATVINNREQRPARVTPANKLSNKKLNVLIKEVQEWRDGKTIVNPAWEPLLDELMDEVRATLPDPRPGLWERLFTKELIKLEGSGRTDARHFVIPREDWATQGIESYLNLLRDEAVSQVEFESIQRAVARLLNRLAKRADISVKRRLLLEPDHWSIDGAIAQVLLARAWLRGAISPEANLEQQFGDLLAQEPPSRDVTERVDSWKELVKATDSQHYKLRELLNSLLILPIGNGKPLYNAGAIAKPLVELRATLRTVPFPVKTDSSRAIDEIATLIRLTERTDSSLRQVFAREATRLEDRKLRVLKLLRGSTLGYQLKRVDDVIKETVTQLVQAAPIERQTLETALQKAVSEKLTDDASDAWSFLRDFLLEDEPTADDEAQADRLSRILSAPVASLSIALDSLEKAERAILAAYNFVYAYVKNHQSKGDLTVVRAFGDKLRRAAELIQNRLHGQP